MDRAGSIGVSATVCVADEEGMLRGGVGDGLDAAGGV